MGASAGQSGTETVDQVEVEEEDEVDGGGRAVAEGLQEWSRPILLIGV